MLPGSLWLLTSCYTPAHEKKIWSSYRPARSAFLLLILLMCVLSAEAQESAQEGVARVIAIAGEVKTIRANGEEVVLQRRAALYPGDTVTTAPKAWVQVQCNDRALLSLMCNSSLQLPGYQYQDRNSDRSELHLRYGRMRTTTGVIPALLPNSRRSQWVGQIPKWRR